MAGAVRSRWFAGSGHRRPAGGEHQLHHQPSAITVRCDPDAAVSGNRRSVPLHAPDHHRRIHHFHRRLQRFESSLRVRSQRQLRAPAAQAHEHRSRLRGTFGAPRDRGAGFRPTAREFRGSEVGPVLDAGGADARTTFTITASPLLRSRPIRVWFRLLPFVQDIFPGLAGAVHPRKRSAPTCSTMPTPNTRAAGRTPLTTSDRVRQSNGGCMFVLRLQHVLSICRTPACIPTLTPASPPTTQ